MKTQFKLLFGTLVAAGLLLPLSTATAQNRAWRVTVDVTDFEPTEPLLEAIDSFELVELFAIETRDQAAALKSFLREPTALGPESHAAKLTRIRENVNDIAAEVGRLEELNIEFLPRQRLALSHVRPHMAVLAASASSAIAILNENPRDHWSSDYETYISEIYERADAIAQAAHMAESRLYVQEYLADMAPDSDD